MLGYIIQIIATNNWLVSFGMVLVYSYHSFCSNHILNTQFEKADGIEKVANTFLAPVHYLCAGKQVKFIGGKYVLKQRFSYKEHKLLLTPVAVSALPTSLTIGSILKYSSYLTKNTHKKHRKLKKQLTSINVESNIEYYKSLGIDVSDYIQGEWFQHKTYAREEGAEKHLSKEKQALQDIAVILRKYNIPFWLDCGTLLGAYRHGGVIPWDEDLDIGIFLNDHQNVLSALNELDKSKYAIQDWSNRNLPETYIRIYIKEVNDHIDVYHFAIHEKEKVVRYILSNQHSHFLPKTWKKRESKYMVSIKYENFFPLKKSKFDDLIMPVPQKSEKYLQRIYGKDLAPVKIYNPKTNKYERNLSHPYWQSPGAR